MKRTKVLLVDDEMEFVSALAERLRLRDYDAKAVYCAEDAIAAAHQEHPDVIVLDMKMPGMHGLDVMKEVKQIDPAVEVIILSGHMGDQAESGSSQIEGVFDYMMKPVDIVELIRKIDLAQLRRADKIAP